MDCADATSGIRGQKRAFKYQSITDRRVGNSSTEITANLLRPSGPETLANWISGADRFLVNFIPLLVCAAFTGRIRKSC